MTVDLDERGRVTEPRHPKAARRRGREIGRRARDDRQRPGRNALFRSAELPTERLDEGARHELLGLDRILEDATLELGRALNAGEAVAGGSGAEGVEKGRE